MYLPTTAMRTRAVGRVIRSTFSFTARDSGRSVQQTMTSGWMPMLRSSRTLCCVGFVLSSPAASRYGTRETCTYITFSAPTSWRNWRVASREGRASVAAPLPPPPRRDDAGVARRAPADLADLLLDLIGDVRDDLHGPAQVYPAALAADDG